jgi:D-alanyl-D-alanine carboxypeptidase/D-alanyl-D-alanine-endopeptidase (penicillin-binding protein 4)
MRRIRRPASASPRSARTCAAALALLALAAASPLAAAEPAGQALAARLEHSLDARALRGARVAALVERESDGAVLFSHSPDRALTPASNAKILTAIAALSSFGPTHRFETVFESAKAPDAEGAVDDLVVRGGGDPALNSEDWWLVASALRSRGLRRVRGDLVLDDSAFDHQRWHPSWGPTSSRAYHAPVGALTANYGAFAVTVAPGAEVGDPVEVEVDPPVPYLRLVNRARTGPPRARRSLSVDRAPTESGQWEVVSVQGVARAGGPPKTYYRSVVDPARYAAAVLRMQLEANGIAVQGGTRVGSPAPGFEIYRHQGRPLAEIVRLFVKYSNNAVAESLLKAMGAAATGEPGSWGTGAPVVARRLAELGLDPGGFHLVDGSGLSTRDKVTPRTLVGALRLARGSFRFGPEFVAALPIAARDGTLEKRAEGSQGEVRAKTGLLDRVTALSGFAHLPEGGTAIFSILVNGYRSSDEEAMGAVDAFVAELVRAPVATAAR